MAGFKIKCTTSAPAEDVALPTTTGHGEGYNATVYWGDGSDSAITAWDDADLTHTYASAGDHIIEIQGQFDGWSVNNTHSSKLQWTDIVDWGDAADFDGFSYLTGGWYGCANLASFGTGKILAKAGLTTLNSCFRGCSGVSVIPSGIFDLLVNLSSYAFYYTLYGCSSIVSLPVDLFKYNVLVSSYGFYSALTHCTSLEVVPSHTFRYNTLVGAYGFHSTFYDCPKLKLDPWLFYADGEQSTRFLNTDVDFRQCFYRTSCTADQGQAPDLWNCDFGTGTPTKTNCFSGNGNNSSSLSNYCSIPAEWGWSAALSIPIILSVDGDDIIFASEEGATIDGTCLASGGLPTLELCNNSVYASATIKVAQTIIGTPSDTEIVFNVVPGALTEDSFVYVFVTSSFGYRNGVGFEIFLENGKPIISSIDFSEAEGGSVLEITGEKFDSSGNLEFCDRDDYVPSTKVIQQIKSYGQEKISFLFDSNELFFGVGYLFLETVKSYMNELGFPVEILTSTQSIEPQGDMVGFGHAQFGRSQYGGMLSDIEPRFISSNPVDESTGVSILYVALQTSVYCFSSRIQDITVEVSENGGDFIDAYVNGSFISPYNASDSYVDFHQADPQETIIKIEKDVPWDTNITVVVRITAYDQFGNQATKESPVVW